MDPNIHEHVGPLPMAENARLFARQRKQILDDLGVTVSVRPTRPQWHEKVNGAPRSMCLAGPRRNMDKAYEIANEKVKGNIGEINADEAQGEDDHSGDDAFPVPSWKKHGKKKNKY